MVKMTRRRYQYNNRWMIVASISLFLCGVAVVLAIGTDDADNHHPANQKICDSRFVPSKVDTSLFVGGEATAQAYKPNAPVKTHVCEESSSNGNNQLHKAAHWSFWRSDYKDNVPIFIKANLFSCNGGAAATRENEEVTMEVWQPRPDGTYSSIRPGIEEGDCRASVQIATTTANNEDDSLIDTNRIGTVEFETFAPGSIGILNGLVPPSSRDYPPYKPGAIHMFLNIDGYHPLLTQLSMSELNDWIPYKISKGRFKLANGKKSFNNKDSGIEIQSVTPTSRSGYNLAIEVEVNFFLVGNGKETNDTIEDIFCSHSLHRGRLSWIPSFFKEPISVCSAAHMDFYAL